MTHAQASLLEFLEIFNAHRYSILFLRLSSKLWPNWRWSWSLRSYTEQWPRGYCSSAGPTFSLSLSRPQLKRKAGQISRIFAEKYRVKSWSFWQIERLLRIVNLSETLFWKAAANYCCCFCCCCCQTQLCMGQKLLHVLPPIKLLIQLDSTLSRMKIEISNIYPWIGKWYQNKKLASVLLLHVLSLIQLLNLVIQL